MTLSVERAAAQVAALVASAIKAEAEPPARDDYRKALLALLALFWAAKITKGEMEKRMAALVKEYGQRTYTEWYGMEADETGLAQRDDWIKKQLAFVGGLISAALLANAPKDEAGVNRTAAQLTAAHQVIEGRIELWARSLQNLDSLMNASMQQDQIVIWHLGPTEEHCLSKEGKMGCANLDRQRHRLSWFVDRGYIPQQNGNECTCGGWRCLCTLDTPEGEQIMP